MLDIFLRRRRIPDLNAGEAGDVVSHDVAGGLNRSIAVALVRHTSIDTHSVDYAGLRNSDEFVELVDCSRSLRGGDPLELETGDDRLAFSLLDKYL